MTIVIQQIYADIGRGAWQYAPHKNLAMPDIHWGYGCEEDLNYIEAVRQAKGRSIESELEQQGIIVMGKGRKGVAEEQPVAYKDVNDVVHVMHESQIARRVARFKPMGVIKG